MGILLDTHILLWAAAGSDRISPTTRTLLTSDTEPVFFSVANIWEVVIKSGLGRADFHVDAAQLRATAIAAGFEELPIRGRHVLEVTTLPQHRADPFDRILLAQARVEGLTLLTIDRAVLSYGAPAMNAL